MQVPSGVISDGKTKFLSEWIKHFWKWFRRAQMSASMLINCSITHVPISNAPPLTKQKKRSNRQCILKQDEENNKNSMEKFSTTYKDARFSDDEKTRKW